MRRRSKLASVLLTSCMAIGLLVNVPAGTAEAAEGKPEILAEEQTLADGETEKDNVVDTDIADVVETSETDFEWDGTTITKYIGTSEDVVIPSKCTEVGFESDSLSDEGVFKDCSFVRSIVIPAGVTSIGSYAFGGCSSLTNITIPESVTSIGYCAFKGCKSLTSITIPEGVTCIDFNTFAGCSGLESITIPETVRSIWFGAFSGCSSLKSITIPEGVPGINSDTFYGCSSLKSITLPDTVTEIEEDAFESCSGLESITIPETVSSIGGRAFYGCSSLKSITIPPKLTGLSQSAFIGCSSLESIVVEEGNAVFDSRNNCNAILEGDTLVRGCMNTVIPNDITTIGEGAFRGCGGLTSLVIPENIKTIEQDAFMDSTDLTSVIIPGSVKRIGHDAFRNCDDLVSVTIPGSVKIIDNDTFFDCDSLSSVTILEGVKSIKKGAFESCDALTSITIPASVESVSIADWDFDGTIPPKAVIYGKTGSYIEYFAQMHGQTFKSIGIQPEAVTNLQATPVGRNKVKLTWNKVNGATGYIVYARKNDRYAKLGVTAATSYTDIEAMDSDFNFYFVYAYKKDSAGKIEVGKCQKYAYAKGTCKAVTNLKASSVKGGVKVTWTKSVGADGYIVYGKHPGGTYGYVGMTSKNTATSFTDKGADKKNYNFYWVFPYHNKNGKRVIGPICGYVYGKAK